jgi:sialic acid synthase SpsE
MTFIIVDACVNFRNIEEAKQIIRKCADAGVDAVKFQAYKKGHPAPGHPRAKEIDAIVMTPEIARELWKECKSVGIEFMCTGMYPESIAWLNPFVKRWKIRFADRHDLDILDAIQDTDKEYKPVIVSTDDPTGKCRRFKAIYCVPEYPPKALPQAKWSKYDGFSSHYPDWHVPATEARHWDLEYLEVHVMLDEYEGGWDPIDSAVSLNITDLKKLVKEVNG